MITIHDIPRPPARPKDAHKGSAGLVFVVAGSRGMAGAAALCGTSALRGGAGLVKIATPDAALDTVAAMAPCCTTAPLPDDGTSITRRAAETVLHLAEGWHVIAMGPGLGQTEAVAAAVCSIIEDAKIPIVLDADGLNVLAHHARDVIRRARVPVIITPHPGEAARLLGITTQEVQADRPAAAARLADLGAVAVLKGAGTVVCDGRRIYVNDTGNPGMATAGAGDVLTGLVAALLASGMKPFDAAVYGVWAHGKAGDLSAARLGILGMIATDILSCVPEALKL
jgi:NAD(P)H-hydrate epimerase